MVTVDYFNERIYNDEKSFDVGDWAIIEYTNDKGYVSMTYPKEIFTITKSHVWFKAKTNNFIEDRIPILGFCKSNFDKKFKIGDIIYKK
jgi:hypothetical protein